MKCSRFTFSFLTIWSPPCNMHVEHPPVMAWDKQLWGGLAPRSLPKLISKVSFEWFLPYSCTSSRHPPPLPPKQAEVAVIKWGWERLRHSQALKPGLRGGWAVRAWALGPGRPEFQSRLGDLGQISWPLWASFHLLIMGTVVESVRTKGMMHLAHCLKQRKCARFVNY